VRILVTGGVGFIGSHLVERLRHDGHQVAVFDKKTGQDVNNFNQLKRVFKKHKFEAVAHLAAQAGVRRSFEEPELYERTNVLGTINLLECLRESPRTGLVFTSSSSVYGNSKVIPFREDDPVLNPLSVYAATKRAAELACQVYAKNYGIKTTILRLFTVYGPNNRRDMAAFTFTRDILAGQPIKLFGDATSRDFTYVQDIVEGIIQAIKRPLKFEIINLGNSAPVPVRQLIKAIEMVTGKKAVVKLEALPVADPQKTWADISKAKRLLGWEPKTNLKQGVEKLVNWFKLT
jgi:UDP-glucuronate 4-epimerase